MLKNNGKLVITVRMVSIYNAPVRKSIRLSGMENSDICSPGRITHFHHSPDHCKIAFDAINKMRHNIQMTDITLKVGDVSIHAHRIVLASTSPYFYAMFNGDMSERLSREVVLHEVDVMALQLLVDYSYTGGILITEDNVQVLLPASSLLQIVTVREACCEFLMGQLHPSNCLGIRSFADAHGCKELHSKSHKYALQNFQEVMSTEEFLLLPFGEVEELISNNQLNIASEEKVFLAVLNWVKHCIADRVQYIAKLLSHVRLPLMSRDFLMTTVDTEVLVRDSAECKELLLEAMKYHLLPEQRSLLISERTCHRRPEGIEHYVFAIGGGSLFAIHSECEVYNPRSDRWFPISPMICKRSRSGVTGLGRMLYVVGGYDGATDLASAESYNPQTNSWTSITSMGTKRSCLGICSFDGLVYACGGYDGASCLSSLERYDPLTGVWSSCPAMNTRRRYCRVAVVENCIYALGGYDSTNYQASVERLDPREGKWTGMPSMSSRRSSCGVASVDGLLYCIGGNDGTMCMASGERFDTRRNSWEPIAPMHSRRSTHEVVNCGGVLVALGGNDGSSSLNSVELYDINLNKWTIVASMMTRRSSVGASILECFNLELAVASSQVMPRNMVLS
ncbi:kelch-like protein 17 isoform X2 [Halyomorpha halys]|uniref:kelch-like protein 17 isoform X2 n=1 Tax=Halyomorpha halys TaxID=286706 RepID=UPI0006D4F0F6|nr:kelch-like protein 17 isoform X3 [Halyomorpha halys]